MQKIDEYTITKEIGSGAAATIKLASGEDDKQYALKMFDVNIYNSMTQVQLNAEIKFSQGLTDHPNIVKYHGFKQNCT